MHGTIRQAAKKSFPKRLIQRDARRQFRAKTNEVVVSFRSNLDLPGTFLGACATLREPLSRLSSFSWANVWEMATP
jgi:hypothetical protein